MSALKRKAEQRDAVESVKKELLYEKAERNEQDENLLTARNVVFATQHQVLIRLKCCTF